MATLEKAIQIAVTAHAGQVDKAGQPYILHPLRVMQTMTTNNERIVAVLHDVLEDTALTYEDLLIDGFGLDEVIRPLLALTRGKGEDYEAFIRRAGRNPISRSVKTADLKDNMNLSRLDVVSSADFRRTKKYQKAYEYLTGEGKS